MDKGNSLLAKWIWRFGREEDSLWRLVICEKYGVDKSSLWWDWQVSKSASQFVRAVSSLFKEVSRTSMVIKEGFRVVLGNGERFRL